MGGQTDRLRADETPDRATATATVAPPEVAPDVTTDPVSHLQSTVGNSGMADIVNGRAPAEVMDAAGIRDGGAPPGVTDAGIHDGGAPPGGVPQTPAPAGGLPQAPAPSGGTPQTPAPPTPSPAPGAGPAPASGTTPASGPAPAPGAVPATGAPPAPETGPAPAPAIPGPVGAPPAAGEGGTGADALDTSGLALIDQELVEHERWGAAAELVGAAGSADRAAFIATEVGGGVGEGFGTGFVMGLVTTIGVQALEAGLEEIAGVAIPGVGAVVGGVMSAYALAQGWDRNTAAIGRMGEGRSGYEEAANDIEGICAILDIASNIINILGGVVGIVAVAAAAAALFTLGALSPLAIAAGSIATAIGMAGMVLGLVKMALQPLVLLFRSLHTFTSQADPREVEAQGHTLEEAGKEMGGALGGLAGAAVAGMGRSQSHEEGTPPPGDEVPPSTHEPAGTPEPLVVEGEPIPGAATEGVPPVEGGTPPAPEGAPPVEGTPPPQEPQNLENLTDAEIDAALSGAPTREATPADFTDADIDALVGRLDNPSQLEAPEFAMSGPVGPDTVNPVTGQVEPAFGLSGTSIQGQNVNPNQIAYHENMQFQGISDVREIPAFPTGAEPTLPGAPGNPVPQTEVRITGPSPGPNQPRPVLSAETGGNVEVRYHSANPGAPEGSFSHDNPTVQVNTPGNNYPWEGQPVNEGAGQRANIRPLPGADGQPTAGRYRTADDQWLRLPNGQQRAGFEAGNPMPPGVATPEQIASSHYPVYGEPSGPIQGGGGAPPTGGGGGGGGVPPTGGGGGTPPPTGGGDLPSVIIDEAALGLQPGEVETFQGPSRRPPERPTDVDWSDPAVQQALGLDANGRPTGSTLSGSGQLEVNPNTRNFDPAGANGPGPFRGELGQVKNGEFAPEGYFDVPERRYNADGTVQPDYGVRVGPPGAWVDHTFSSLEEAQAYAAWVSSQSPGGIRNTSALPHGWPADASGTVYPGNPVDAVRILEVPGGTPQIRSEVAPQPEGLPAPDRPNVYPGGGPQTQLPKHLFPRAPAGGVSPAQVGPELPITGNWFDRLQQYPGRDRALAMHETVEGLEHRTRLAERAHRGEQAGAIVDRAGGGAEHESHAPVVESVNPAYQPPPGTHEQIEQMTRDIDRLLTARAQAEQRQARAQQVRTQAEAQGAQVSEAQQASAQALTATQAHQAQVQRREQLNQQRAQAHQEGGGHIQDSASQLAGIGTLETLLAGWTGFTGLVLDFSSVLPDSAVSAFHKMNTDSATFMAKLVQTRQGIAGHAAAQPGRGAEIAQAGQRLTTTSAQAEATEAQFTQSQQQAAQLAEANQRHVAAAEADRAEASANASRADTAATSLTERRDTLAAQMQAWATEHKAARDAAVEETVARMEARGMRVTHRPEH
ncbi:hypothetical protein [Actinocrispum sp. NPDC049592]|uniref:hypothetical protein n=1 Tax=Actinocrispum sp. NPDC049592 TaxID=3154835 RepID=UPI00342D6E2A